MDVHLTEEGLERLRRELEHLKGPRRREVIQAVKTAREHGDLSENAEYDAAKEEQGKLEARIGQLEEQLSRAVVIDKAKIPEDRISIGKTVRLQDRDTGETLTYTLVSPQEADFEAGRISMTSPVGKGLIGKQAGVTVDIRIPAGVRRYTILSVTLA